MNCTEAQQNLNRVLQGIVAGVDEATFEHVQICDLCKQYYSDRRLTQKLMSLEVPEPGPRFIDDCIAGAIAAKRKRQKNTVNLLAMCATLVIGILVGVLFGNHYRADVEVLDTDQLVEIFEHQIKPVNIVIDSDLHVSEATITISLADNVEIEGYPDTRELSWNTELLKGRNLLTVPVKLIGGNQGHFDVSYASGENLYSARVRIHAKPLPPTT